MSAMTDIIDDLRANGQDAAADALGHARNVVSDLRSENEKLRAALEPFAQVSEKLERIIRGEEWSDDDFIPTSMQSPGIKLGDLRRAKACITGSQIEEPSSATRTDQPDGEEA